VTAPSVRRMNMGTRYLGATIEELLPKLRTARVGSEFLFDPEVLDGYPTVRDYYVEYLRWLDIPPEALPTSRFHIHGDRPHPADIEFRTDERGAGSFLDASLFLSMRLFRSFDAVKMALAHEMTHLCLVRRGLQTLPQSSAGFRRTTALPEDEEVRTDVASILLGFGKLVLNGAAEWAADPRPGRIEQLGYLPVSSFAYLYRRVNELMDVPSSIARDGLTAAASSALDDANSWR
jgi:hypothetical protein